MVWNWKRTILDKIAHSELVQNSDNLTQVSVYTTNPTERSTAAIERSTNENDLE